MTLRKKRDWSGPRNNLEMVLGPARDHESDECLLWTGMTNNYGYGRISIDGKNYQVHRLVLEHLVGPPPSNRHECGHLPSVCHTRHCYNPRHLRWVTPSENRRDQRIDGTAPIGERNPVAKLTEDDVRAIRADPRSTREIGLAYGIAQQTAWAVKSGKTWKHVR